MAQPVPLVERIRNHPSGLSPKQLAEFLGCTPRNVQAQAKAKKIPNYRVGGAVMFDPVEVANWLENCKVA